MIVYT